VKSYGSAPFLGVVAVSGNVELGGGGEDGGTAELEESQSGFHDGSSQFKISPGDYGLGFSAG
jgi:hypothetical protein